MNQILMCPPDFLDTGVQNNVWMKELARKGQSIKIDHPKAMHQFMDFARLFTENSLVYLLPPMPRLQDQVYVSNVAVVLPHVKHPTAVLAHFKAPGRPGEEPPARRFLTDLGFTVKQCPTFFEGQADFRWLRDNIYFGAYGIRTMRPALDWIARTFKATVIPIEQNDPKLYHLDCSVFPLDDENVLVSTETLTPRDIAAIEKVANVIPVTKEDAYGGITNGVLLDYVMYNGSALAELHKGTDDYDKEVTKNTNLERICSKLGLELVFVNISEIAKSGAALSCCVLFLEHNGITLNYDPMGKR